MFPVFPSSSHVSWFVYYWCHQWLQCHPQSAPFSKITMNSKKSELSPCSNQTATNSVTERAVHWVNGLQACPYVNRPCRDVTSFRIISWKLWPFLSARDKKLCHYLKMQVKCTKLQVGKKKNHFPSREEHLSPSMDYRFFKTSGQEDTSSCRVYLMNAVFIWGPVWSLSLKQSDFNCS